MIADNIPVAAVGTSHFTTSCIMVGSADESSFIPMTHTVSPATPVQNISYNDLSMSVQKTLTNAYKDAVATGRAVETEIQLTVLINGVDVSANIADTMSINWPDNGNGSGTMVLVGYNPFSTVPTSLPIDAGGGVRINALLTVNDLQYRFTVFSGFIADMHYQNRTLSLSLIDASYPFSLTSSRLNKNFGRTTKSHLLQLVAQHAGILSVINERQGQVEDEVMVLPATANQELPLDFMKKHSVPQTWKLGFNARGDLRIWREQIKATPDHVITDNILLSGSLTMRKNVEGVINAQEVTGHTYPIGQKIDKPPIDPCKPQKKVEPINPIKPPVRVSCKHNHRPILLTSAPNYCAITQAQAKSTSPCDAECVKLPVKKPDNTPTDPCANPHTPPPPLTIVGG